MGKKKNPPPAPGGGPPPPPPPNLGGGSGGLPKIPAGRGGLLSAIQKGKKLNKAQTNDRSAPAVVASKPGGGGGGGGGGLFGGGPPRLPGSGGPPRPNSGGAPKMPVLPGGGGAAGGFKLPPPGKKPPMMSGGTNKPPAPSPGTKPGSFHGSYPPGPPLAGKKPPGPPSAASKPRAAAPAGFNPFGNGPPSRKPAAKKPQGQYVKTLYDYEAQNGDELGFTAGVVLELTKENSDGWWEGVLNGNKGLFPHNYVEKCDPPASAEPVAVAVAEPPASPMSSELHKPSSATVSGGLFQAQALYDYDPIDNPQGLGVQTGEVLAILKSGVDGWWKGRNALGKTGLVPSAYMTKVPAGTPSTHSATQAAPAAAAAISTQNNNLAKKSPGIPSKALKPALSPTNTSSVSSTSGGSVSSGNTELIAKIAAAKKTRDSLQVKVEKAQNEAKGVKRMLDAQEARLKDIQEKLFHAGSADSCAAEESDRLWAKLAKVLQSLEESDA